MLTRGPIDGNSARKAYGDKRNIEFVQEINIHSRPWAQYLNIN